MKRKTKPFIRSKFTLAVVIPIVLTLSILVVDLIPRHVLSNILGNSSSENSRRTSETCQTRPETAFNQSSINIPNSGDTIVKSDEIRAGQSVLYTFNAREDQRVTYNITSNLCTQIYTPNNQLLATQELPETGQYKIYVWALSGSTTFDLEISLDSIEENQTITASPSASAPSPSPNFEPHNQPISSEDSYLGHLAYSEADPANLMLVGSYGRDSYQRFETMDVEAGKALMDMIYTARDAGIWLIPTSGFRGFKRQQKLFEEQIQKLGSAEAAARVSAPPGHSEHHTGFALDLADGRLLKKEFSASFAETEAYRWLTQNAARFGFELSFPLNNLQGVSFEPWHWRFVGSSRAATTFTKAITLN